MKTLLRAGVGLALALTLAAFTSPALGESGFDEDVLRAAAGEPSVISDVQPSADAVVRPVLQQLGERVAADLAEHAAAVEAWKAAEHAAAVEAWKAAEHAAAVERWNAAVAAEEARRAEAARKAQAAQAAASAPAGSVEAIIQRHFGAAAPAAIRVARCESGLNPRAVSPGGGNHGLFQINNVHRGTFESVTGAPWSAVYDAETNTRFARWLYGQQGWGPWACA
jgi:hypothetical protein